MRRPLSSLRPGEGGRLCEPSSAGPPPPRLQNLGFVPGTEVRVVRRAPLGDPIELELRSYRVCLRADQLAGLEVECEACA